MEPKDFFSALLMRKGYNPTSLTNAINSIGGDVVQSTLHRFLKGKTTEPRRETMCQVADFLGVNPESFYSPAIAESEAIRLKLIERATPAPSGDRPNRPSGSPWAGDTTLARAPVVKWARLGAELYREAEDLAAAEWSEFIPTAPISPLCKLVTVDDDSLAPRIARGDLVGIDPNNLKPRRGQVALFRAKTDGEFFLRRYQPLDGDAFEAVDSSGKVLDSKRHALEIVGTACGVRLQEV